MVRWVVGSVVNRELFVERQETPNVVLLVLVQMLFAGHQLTFQAGIWLGIHWGYGPL